METLEWLHCGTVMKVHAELVRAGSFMKSSWVLQRRPRTEVVIQLILD
jgi:hypothetical protein